MSQNKWMFMLGVAIMGTSTLGTTLHAKPATGQTSLQSAVEIPDTPSGQRMKGWLQALSSGNMETLQAFIEENYEPQQLQRRSALDRARMEMDFLEGFGQRHPVRLIKSTPLETTVEGEAAVLEDWKKLTLRVSPDAPHRVVALMSEPAEPPASWKEKFRSQQPLSHLQNYASKLAHADRFSGVVLLAKNDKVLLSQAYGQADRSKALPNRMETRFGIASMGKMFTAVAIAQLVEAGKLRYDDTIAKVLPDYPNREIAEKVTIHHLLSHTSGLGDFFDKPGFAEPGLPLLRPRDFFRLFASDALKFEPGKGWDYSNAGFIILGAIIEHVSGQDFHSYVRQHIFQPAGMTQTGYAVSASPGTRTISDLAIGYTKMGSAQWKPGPSDGAGGPAGGGFSTAGDLLRFAHALLGHHLVSSQSLNMMTTGKAVANFAPDAEYGYGFMLQGGHGEKSFGHGGGFPGVCTQMDIFPLSGTVCIVLSNYDPPGANKIAVRAREVINESEK